MAVNRLEGAQEKILVKGAVRRKLPRVRNSRTYHFELSDLKGYFTVGLYEDGQPGELFISVSKQGSTLAGLMDSFAISVSHGLQYGVPLKSYVKTLRGTTFAPSGMTDDPDVRTASSITDYIFRRLALDYLSFDDRLELGLASIEDMPETQTSLLTDDQSAEGHMVHESHDHESEEAVPKVTVAEAAIDSDVPTLQQEVKAASVSSIVGASSKTAKLPADDNAPLCFNCGNQTQRAGSCYVCSSCGSTSGCS